MQKLTQLTEKKHIKKIKPQSRRPSGWGGVAESGSGPCPPVGG